MGSRFISGTSVSASALFGFERIPTVSMACMQQELPIAFGPKNGAVDDCRVEAEGFDGETDPVAGRPMHSRIANDSALSDFRKWD